MKSRTVEHVMGPLHQGVQECARCGEILTDYRDASWPAGQDAPSGLTPGQRYVKSDHPSGAGFGASRELVGQLAVACEPIQEHVAGKPENGRQPCARCGADLLVARPGSPALTGWAPEGEAVVSTGTMVMPREKWPGESRSCHAQVSTLPA